ncbi:hypothetical protein IB267_07055 [Ensifer sp. ENS09]|uniref:hypothetical protein n=1 Tax=Ensifer sp. ENS09 TaxID=2769263 RepID=UPI001786D2AB|nr:hypothetical protein [Ensifer sp. ENS09]MBD9648110.1 hypothetical protein [Ensifer sp. ENS09]
MMHADGCSIGFRSSFTASFKSTSQDKTGAEMTCDNYEHTERKPFLSFEPVTRLVAGLFGGLVAAKPTLDVNALPDHIKRDMGFMDGRGPYGDDEEAMAASRRLFSVDEMPRF